MANQLLLTSNMALSGPGVNVPVFNPGIIASVPLTLNNSAGIYSVPTTPGGVVIPTAGLNVLGYAQFYNLDKVNTVKILSAVSGTVVAIVPPGGVAGPIFMGTPAPAWVAEVAPCEMAFFISDGSSAG